MRQYERYVLLHLLWPTVVITASLTALIWLTQILKYLDFVLSRGLSMADFFTLVGLMLPSLLLILMPIAFTIATIYTYNKLMVESELIVLNAVGVSRWQLARPALMLGVAITATGYVLSLYLMPIANAKFQDIRTFFRDKYASVLLQEEVFNSPMDGVTVYVRERDGKNNLTGVVMHDSRSERNTVTMVAEHGHLEQTPAGPRFHLQQGIRQERTPDGRINWLTFDDYDIDIAFYGHDAERERGTKERTIGELFNSEGLSESQVAAYHAEAHQRLTWPMLALTLPLWALALLLTSEFDRRGQLRRILGASFGMVALLILYFACRSMSLKHAWVAGGLYVLVFGVAAYSVRWLAFGRRQHVTQALTPHAAPGGAS